MKSFFPRFFFLSAICINSFVSCNAQSEPVINNETTTDPQGYHLVWQDNFDGTQLDEINNWAVEVNGDGGGNSELQYYRRENISVGTEPLSGKNCLIITAKKENFSGKTCTSGRLTTRGKMSFKHGKLEARIKLPHTANGLWPAFWAMGADYAQVGWPKCGEMDILEMGNVNGINRGTQDRYFSTWFHWGESWNGGAYPNWGKDITVASSIQEDFHLFTLIWDENVVKTFIDLDVNPAATPIAEMAINGADVAGNAAHYFHKKFFVIFNLAIGGNFTQIWDINKITALAAGDAKMYVDYVRVYQKGDATEEYSGPALTSVKSVKSDKSITIYPNPVNDRLTIDSSVEINKATIIDMSGKELFAVSNSREINTSNLKKGHYLLQVIDVAGKIQTFKFSK